MIECLNLRVFVSRARVCDRPNGGSVKLVVFIIKQLSTSPSCICSSANQLGFHNLVGNYVAWEDKAHKARTVLGD
jgi:hypothetical protein